jgi:preprotein translocase subunit SecG
MLAFFVAVTVISALALIVLVMFHPDGRLLGESGGPLLADPKKKSGSPVIFTAYDKLILAVTLAFFGSVIGSNYVTLYKEVGEVSVNKIIERQKILQKQKEISKNPVGADSSPPIAK